MESCPAEKVRQDFFFAYFVGNAYLRLFYLINCYEKRKFNLSRACLFFFLYGGVLTNLLLF